MIFRAHNKFIFHFCVIVAFLVCLANCNLPSSSTLPPATPVQNSHEINTRQVLLDFEQPNPPVEWCELSDTLSTPSANSTQPAATPVILARSSIRPNTGLWSLKAALIPDRQGQLVHRFETPVDFQAFDTLSAAITQAAAPTRNGEYVARLYILDEDGRKISGDALPITSRWQNLLLDLLPLANQPDKEPAINLSRVVVMGIELHLAHSAASPAAESLDVQTDTWSASRDFRAYQGERLGPSKTFYAQRNGTRLQVGVPGQYELTFYQRTGPKRPWLTVTQGPKQNLALGQPGTGLMLLDQNLYDALAPQVHQDSFASDALSAAPLPSAGWPVRASDDPNDPQTADTHWRWECVWTSSIATIVEVKQEVGPYDRLGEPAARLTWRFMIYQWGQVFAHVSWIKSLSSVDTANPITWALVLDDSARHLDTSSPGIDAKSPAEAQRLLADIYPLAIRDGLKTALPHQMQTAAPVAMIAKSGAAAPTGHENNLWWWARGNDPLSWRAFGVGLAGPRNLAASDCMLLVNSPNALMQASSFAQYLVPPKVKVREGELDRNFPGDFDNDGLVESYGFQVIRLARGRATFTVYPQERPLFYPPFLFTVPAVERDTVHLKNSRLLINIDGQQFADPPQFPDGSFLLQLPYIINRPLQIEAILVNK